MELPAAVPDACTLPTVEQPVRVAEWDALFLDLVAVGRPDPAHGRLAFEGGPGLEDRVHDLSRRETECCRFFDFTVTVGHGTGPAARRHTVVLEGSVPGSRIAVLDAFVQWADDVRTGRREVR